VVGVLISHLALNVRDPERSRRFYLDTLGLDATADREEWGYRVRMADGVTFALLEGEPPPPDVIGRIHFGCDLPDPDAVRAVRQRLRGEGVDEVEWWDEVGYTSLKVADPDGYVVELAHDDG
jgi:catechol 2,3-dioxygenase-like lactoylglutathione lyase family enzyme